MQVLPFYPSLLPLMNEPEEFKPNCELNIPDHRPILESLEPLVPPAGIANPVLWCSFNLSS